MSKRSSTRWWYALAAALVLLHAALGAWSIAVHTSAYDETMHVAAGHVLWETGRPTMDTFHPPLPRLWVAAPLRGLGLRVPYDTREFRGKFRYAFGERFLFWSGNDADAVLRRARAMNLALSLVLAAALWFFARRRWGEGPAAFTLALYAFSPNLLAHASLALTDLPAVFFGTLAVAAFLDFLDRPEPGPALRTAAAAFGALLCKYSSVLLGVVFAAALAIEWAKDRKEGRRRIVVFARWAGGFGAAAVALFVLLYPPALGALLNQLSLVSGGVHPSFLLGRTSETGWLAYYPVAFLVKSTLAELAVSGAALWSLCLWRKTPRGVWLPLLAAAVYFCAVAVSRIQIGIRYMLILYPMLALAAAPLAQAALKGKGPGRTFILVCALLQAVSAFSAAPHFLAFFNAASGGSSGGHRILVDSNLDWGQELKALGEAHRRAGRPEVILAYFGTASAEYYGVLAQQLKSTTAIQRRHRNSDRPRAEWLVVSATLLEGAYAGRGTFAWLREREPLMVIGYGLFVYDISRDADSHRRLAELYAADGDGDLAARERRRAELILAPEGST